MKLPFRLGLRGELLLMLVGVLVVVVSLFTALWWHEKRSNQWDPLESTCRHASLSIL